MSLANCGHCRGTTMDGCPSCRVGNEPGVCKVCEGDGVVNFPIGAIPCPHCGRTGMNACAKCRVGPVPGICQVCKGVGLVAPTPGGVLCRHCAGQGMHNLSLIHISEPTRLL